MDAEGNPAKRVKVKIKGPKGETEVQTDEQGYYEIQDVPEGKYEITPDEEQGYEKAEVEVKKGGAEESTEVGAGVEGGR